MHFFRNLLHIFYFTLSLFFTLNSFAESNCQQSIAHLKVSEQLELGVNILEDGIDSKDFVLKEIPYANVAEQGNPYAQFALGLLHSHVIDGVFPSNDRKAVYWLEKSAQQGLPNAQLFLSFIYYKSEDENIRDYVKAYKWLSLFLPNEQPTDENLKRILNDLESKMTKDQIEEAQKLINQFKVQ